MSSARVALLLFQVQQERNFIHDDLIPNVSAELSRLGVANDIFETTLPEIGGDAADERAAFVDLADRLRGRYQTAVYTRIWSAAMFDALRELLPEVTWVHLGDARNAFDGTHHRLGAARVAALAEIARSVADQSALPSSLDSLPQSDLRAPAARSNLVRVRVGGGATPERPAVVHGSPGCAYSADIRLNPEFANVSFPDDGSVVLSGCSFCATGGVPRRAAAETLGSVIMQLERVIENEPDVRRIQINDQNPFPYLVPFVERAASIARQPLEVLIETRADWLLGALPVFERALSVARRAGHRILLFLVGIENFSPKVLARLNKGVTALQNEQVVAACRRLYEQYPDAYSDTRAAFGFILYDPWTDLDDLQTNAIACERIRFQQFRGEIFRSKLRLYPNTALYYKARADGLLTDEFAYAAMDSARRYGYEAEVPWRFANAETSAAYGVHDALAAELGAHDEMKLLLQIVRFLRRNPAAVTYPVAEVARDFRAGLSTWIDRSVRHSTRS